MQERSSKTAEGVRRAGQSHPCEDLGVQGLPDLHRRWELELRRFVTIDAGYSMGKYQKKNILYRALPLEIQKEVDSVSARTGSSLEEYDAFIELVVKPFKIMAIPATHKPETSVGQHRGRTSSSPRPGRTSARQQQLPVLIRRMAPIPTN